MNSVTTIEAENAHTALLTEQIEPTINKTLRGKLRISLKESDFSRTNQDALEIAAAVKLILINELRRLKSDSGGKAVHNLTVSSFPLQSTLTVNTCAPNICFASS